MWPGTSILLVAFAGMSGQEMTVIDTSLSKADRQLILSALQSPRGHYPCERASQLSGIPARTLRDWRQSGVLVPDWSNSSPYGWSYRDIVYARLMAWLRGKGMNRDDAAGRIGLLRDELAAADIDPTIADDPTVRSDGMVFLIGQEHIDRLTGKQVFGALISFLDVFELVEPIEDVSKGNLWGPSLIRPSEHTYISPNVVAGEPCIIDSRIPTSTIHGLRSERGLDVHNIIALYPQLDEARIIDAIGLESRLRRALPRAA